VVAVYGAISTPKVKVVIEVHSHFSAGVEKYKQQSYQEILTSYSHPTLNSFPSQTLQHSEDQSTISVFIMYILASSCLG